MFLVPKEPTRLLQNTSPIGGAQKTALGSNDITVRLDCKAFFLLERPSFLNNGVYFRPWNLYCGGTQIEPHYMRLISSSAISRFNT